MKITESSKIKRARNTVFKEMDGAICILNPKFNTIHTLNPSATFIWKYLSRPRSMVEIVKAVQGKYDAPSASVKKDVSNFVISYVEKGFLVLS